MPSIEQCDAAAVNVAALPATLEMFENFKRTSDNGKDSDSEESFHLQLDEDFIENGSVVSNGNDKEQKCEETEDDILNKFDTAVPDTTDHLDACDEDVILNDIDDDKDSEKVAEKAVILSPVLLSNTDVKITYGFKDYEESGDGEFKSAYEVDAKPPESDVETQKKPDEVMEVVPEDVETTSNEPPPAADVSMDAEAQTDPAREDVTMKEDLEGDADVNMSEPSNSSALPAEPPKCEGVSEDTADDSPQQDANEVLTKPNTNAAAQSDEKTLFKIPDELAKDAQACGSEVSNDKTEDDESDLLDVSMVRETEEDDAFAIADAIEDTDKETQASEKSDEEQSERMETEQEGSDADKDNFDNDNAMGFDDGDEEGDDAESRVRKPDGSDSDTERKSKMGEMSDSSKDSVSDSNSKLDTDVKTSDTNVDDKSTNDDTVSDDELPLIVRARGLKNGSVTSTCDTNETNDIKEDAKDNEKVTTACEEVAEEKTVEESGKIQSEQRKANLSKRSNSFEDDGASKKLKLSEDVQESSETDQQLTTSSATGEPPVAAENVNTLTSFVKFMQCQKLTGKLSRSDLEQFCIQKICESLMLKSSEGELHQTIKKHEKTIETIRKDLQQLSKQCKDLEIVNKKLMGELKGQNAVKKAVMPLRITRSVGLQVRLNPGNEVANQNRRRTTIISPVKSAAANHTLNNRSKTGPATIQVTRQMVQSSPQKSPLTTGQPTTPVMAPMLATALQKRAAAAKRTPSSKKQAEKTGNPGVIDLTEEDDKLAQNKSHTNAMKIINNIATGTKNISTKSSAKNGKQVVQSKTIPLNTSKGNNLSQGIRLTSTSVISSSANGSPQMLYVVPTITSNSNGQQKVAFVNFQPGSLNGSTVSVMSGKQGQTLTLKTLPSSIRHKHPAPLQAPPRISLDPKLKPLLPKPHLTIKKIDTGIILQWKMPYNLDSYENIASYQLYAYQETNSAPSTDMWRKVGDVKALALPMACTLTQFADKNKYFFAVRAVDIHKRIGAFSEPEEISL